MPLQLADKAVRLAQFEARAIFNQKDFVPGTFLYGVNIGGNGLLSTLYAASVDSGATVSAKWYDYSTGQEFGEMNLLAEHTPLTASETGNKLFLSGTTDKLLVEITVTGGNATVGLYGSVIESIGTDLGQAIKEDGQTAAGTDKALVVAGLDETEGKYFVIRTDHGTLLIKQDEGQPYLAFDEVTVIDEPEPDQVIAIHAETVPADTQRRYELVQFSTRRSGYFRASLDGVPVGLVRSGPAALNPVMSWSPYLRAAAGQELVITWEPAEIIIDFETQMSYSLQASDWPA